jgi:hypothetical protein
VWPLRAGPFRQARVGPRVLPVDTVIGMAYGNNLKRVPTDSGTHWKCPLCRRGHLRVHGSADGPLTRCSRWRADGKGCNYGQDVPPPVSSPDTLPWGGGDMESWLKAAEMERQAKKAARRRAKAAQPPGPPDVKPPLTLGSALSYGVALVYFESTLAIATSGRDLSQCHARTLPFLECTDGPLHQARLHVGAPSGCAVVAGHWTGLTRPIAPRANAVIAEAQKAGWSAGRRDVNGATLVWIHFGLASPMWFAALERHIRRDRH